MTKQSLRTVSNEQTRMTINVLSTMAATFVVAVAALLVLAGSSLNEAFVAGAVAMGAAFINLVRRPPAEVNDSSEQTRLRDFNHSAHGLAAGLVDDRGE